MKKNTKIMLCNIIIIFTNALLFFNSFMEIDINSKDKVTRGIAQTVIFFSVALLIYINGIFIYEFMYNRISKLKVKSSLVKWVKVDKQDKKNKNDNKEAQILDRRKSVYIKRLRHTKNKKLFKENVKYIIGQTSRIDKKLKVLNEIINTRFRKGDITYNRLYGDIKEIDNIFYFNIMQIVHKLEACDENEKNKVYLLYKQAIEQGISDNEEILIKLDELIIEFSRLVRKENMDGEEGVPKAVQKIDELIQISRCYK